MKKMMMLLQTVILLSWAAKECNAFVPSVLIPRRDLLLRTYLSNNNNHVITTKSEVKVKHCIPLQELGLEDLPKVGGKSIELVCVHARSCFITSLTYILAIMLSLYQAKRPH